MALAGPGVVPRRRRPDEVPRGYPSARAGLALAEVIDMQLVRQVPFRARRRHPTLAALAMMTGVATWVAVGLGAVVGPRVMKCFCESKSDVARATVARYVDEAYPSWQAAHPERLCPQRLSELDEFMTARHGLDVWGNPYHFACGPNMVPAGAGTFWVISAGEDGQFGTDDDIRSDR